MRLEDIVFDREVFVKFPLCRGNWNLEHNGSGCLLTAFMAACGFDPLYPFLPDKVLEVFEYTGDTKPQAIQRRSDIMYYFDKWVDKVAYPLIEEVIAKLPQKQIEPPRAVVKEDQELVCV